MVMMQGQKSRTTEAYLRILVLYWTWGIGIAVQSETFVLARGCPHGHCAGRLPVYARFMFVNVYVYLLSFPVLLVF